MFKVSHIKDDSGDTIGGSKGDTRSSDYSSLYPIAIPVLERGVLRVMPEEAQAPFKAGRKQGRHITKQYWYPA